MQNKKTVASREKDLQKMVAELEKMKIESEQDTADYSAAQKHFHAVSAGLSANDDGAAATLNEQLLGLYNICHRFTNLDITTTDLM